MTITQNKQAPLKVEVVESDAERVEAADYGAWTTTSLTGTENAYTLLPRDRYRRRAVIQANAPAAAANPNTSKPATATGAANAATTLTIPAGIGSPNVLTYLSVSFSGTTLTLATLTVTDGTITLTWTLPIGLSQPFNAQLPTGGLIFATGAAITITVTAIGAALTSTINAGYQVNQFATPFSNNALGYCLIGSRKQVQNGQGTKVRVGNAFVVENQQDVYVTGDGVTAIDVLVLNERYDPNAKCNEENDDSDS